MTNEQLQAIRARAEAATPGPWNVSRTGMAVSVRTCNARAIMKQMSSEAQAAADCEFVAHAREDVPALLAEVDTLRRWTVALQTELDQVRQERDRARRALHLRDLEDTGLYDAYGQSLK